MDFYRNVQDLPERPAKPLYNAVLDLSVPSEDAEILTLDEVKPHLLIELSNTDHDTYLTTLIRQCRRTLEKFTGRSIVNKTITATLKNELGNIELPYGPVLDIVNAKDIDGNTLDAANYDVRGETFKWLETKYDYIKITYATGFDPLVIPIGDYYIDDMKQAILCEIAFRWKHRGDEVGVSGLSPMAKSIAGPYKRQTWLL